METVIVYSDGKPTELSNLVNTSKQMVSLKIKFIRIHITYLESNFLYDIVDM